MHIPARAFQTTCSYSFFCTCKVCDVCFVRVSYCGRQWGLSLEMNLYFCKAGIRHFHEKTFPPFPPFPSWWFDAFGLSGQISFAIEKAILVFRVQGGWQELKRIENHDVKCVYFQNPWCWFAVFRHSFINQFVFLYVNICCWNKFLWCTNVLICSHSFGQGHFCIDNIVLWYTYCDQPYACKKNCLEVVMLGGFNSVRWSPPGWVFCYSFTVDSALQSWEMSWNFLYPGVLGQVGVQKYISYIPVSPIYLFFFRVTYV